MARSRPPPKATAAPPSEPSKEAPTKRKSSKSTPPEPEESPRKPKKVKFAPRPEAEKQDIKAHGCLLFLNGYPGIGKLSIANALREACISKGRNVRVIDYNLIFNLARAVIPPQGDARAVLAGCLWVNVHNGIQTELEADNNLIVIITRDLVQGDEENWTTFHQQLDCISKMPQHLREAIKPIFVNLTCRLEEHKARFNDPQRMAQVGTKMIDEAELDICMENELFNIYTVNRDYQGNLNEWKLDTTNRSIEESASEIEWKMWGYIDPAKRRQGGEEAP